MSCAVATPTVVPLDGGTPAADGQLGGKGASLAQLVRAGFDIPPTAVVTADAYRQVVADPALAGLLARLRGGALPASAGEVDAAFLDAPLPPAISKSIVDAAAAVGAGDPVAVRSSATVEDMADTSFAGQFRSSLNVRGAAAVLRAVRLTWASLWHPAPCAYRRAWGIADAGIAMPVVIMRMVAARMAGVAFTVDPGGEHDRVRVEAVPGLGEALASGDRTPEVWLFSRSRSLLPPADGDPPAPVRQVVEVALRLERACGVPQDVEWAWDGELLWVVQARPITAGHAQRGDGCDTPVDGSELTTAGVGEMLPGVLPPLVWDINAYLVEEALRGVLWQLRMEPPGRSRFIRRVNGRAALDLSLLKAVAAGLPGGSEAELERQYFGSAPDSSAPDSSAPDSSEAAVGPADGRWRHLRHHVRAATARRHAAVEAGIVLAVLSELIVDRPALARWTDSSLLAYRRRLIDLGARAMTAELAVAAAAVAAYRQLEVTLATHLGDREAARAAQRVTVGAGAPRHLDPAMSRSIFAGPAWEETGSAPADPPGLPAADREAARQALERRLRADRKWRRTRLLTGQFVDVRMHVLRRLIGDATDGLVRRERVKAAVLMLGGEVRRVHQEAGRRLVAAGLLDRAEDVDLLRDRELRTAFTGRLPPPAELARRRRWLRQWQADPPLPVRFTGVPEPRPVIAPAGDQLRGWAASPGRHTARARVVTDPATGRLEADEVLVAVATDAGWSPLFIRAGAIVVERGGPLSHAAIVARELGVPAVLNLPGATAVLDGRLVTVDGDAGVVTIHPDGELP